MGHHALACEGLSYLDVVPGTPSSTLDDLCDIHLSLFGGSYAHATSDLERTWRQGSVEPDIIEHQWLLHYRGRPCGEFVFRVNLRRGIVCRLFLGLLPDARSQVGAEWITAVLGQCERVASAESGRAGRPLLAMMSEVQPRHVRGWRRLGHVVPDIGYREPLHGSRWRDFGDLRYQPMAANFLILDAGSSVDMAQIATAGVKAFLLDYYDVPHDDPVLQEILRSCDRL